MAAPKKAAARKKPAAKKNPVAKKAPVARKKPAAKKKAPVKAATKKKATPEKGSAAYSREAMEKVKREQGKKPQAKAAEQPLMKALRAEHRHMATVMQLFVDQLKALEDGEPVDPHVVYEIMDYMVNWPDKFHHPREDLIYSRVAELDVQAADEVDSLQRDHDRTGTNGRKLLKDIQGWREGDVTPARIIKAGRAYVDHLYEHMNVEEKVVFPHIESVLTLEDWRELAEDDELKAVSVPVFGPRVQREFRAMARRMRRRVRRSVERGTMVEWIGIEAFMESLEVLSQAYDIVRSTAEDHFKSAVEESRELFNEAPLTAPVRCAVNNTRLSMALVREMLNISREAFEDLSRVNKARQERVDILDR